MTTDFYLDIENDNLVIKYADEAGIYNRVVENMNDFDSFFRQKAKEANVPVEQLHILCSSSLDFPTEFTTNAKTIALANWVRS